MDDALTKWWVIFDDGSLGAVRCDSGKEPVLSRRGRFVSEEEYLTARAALKAATEEHRAAVAAVEETTLRGDYEALIALKVPEATARRLTGYILEEA